MQYIYYDNNINYDVAEYLWLFINFITIKLIFTNRRYFYLLLNIVYIYLLNILN